MYFKQLVKEDLGCASYIIGCLSAGSCAVVDPRLDMVEEILSLTTDRGLQIAAVIETHNHADHISGHGEIGRRTGSPIYVHEQADVAFPHKNLQDGDELTLGMIKMRVMHTPGHRPEHIALTVADTSCSDEPWLVLTGDSLFIGDVARPDLAVAGETGADQLYGSIFERLLSLDDGVEVYPSHVAGSLCGRGMNAKTSSTIGFERRHNPTVSPRSRATFIHDLNENLPPRPPNMYTIIEQNRGDYRQFPSVLVPLALDPKTFQDEMEQGALVVDTRSPRQFCHGHIPGALHVYLRGTAFANRVGFIAPAASRVLLVVENSADLTLAMNQLTVVGYNQVAGYLIDSMDSWQEAGLPVQQLAQLSARELHEQQDTLTIIDARDPGEWQEGHIASARSIPFYHLEQHLAELDPSARIAVLCAAGQRSAIACSILQRHGFQHVFNVTGGMDAWRLYHLPEVR